MAECKVVVECCTGQTNCNDSVTIGYLKNFVGNNVKDSNGNTVSVTTSKDDTYVPTYSELTGGTLIPLFVDGGTNKWHSNVDGITITGTYSANQEVKNEDLVLTYTRFKSLSISAGKTTFSECGDNTDICATYKLTKTIKRLNNCTAEETSTEGNDTTCKPSFSGSVAWATLGSCSSNCVNVSVGKNGSWSANSRSFNVVAKVTYKGQEYSSNTVSITQNALTGSYSVDEGKHYTKTEITSHSETSQTTCDEVTVYANATATFYTRKKWKDSCGEIYEYNYQDTYGTESAGSQSYTFPAVDCPTETSNVSHTITIEYQNHSDSVTFRQICNQLCSCDDETIYGSGNGTASCDSCGGNVTVYANVSTTIIRKDWDGSGNCVETGRTTTTTQQSIQVLVPENNTQSTTSYTGSKTTLEGGTINYTINQEAGPCGGCGPSVTTYEYGNVNVDCHAHSSVNVPYSATTHYTNDSCADEKTYGTSAYTISISCNETSSTKTIQSSPFIITQAAGPCCTPECDCSKLNITPLF